MPAKKLPYDQFVKSFELAPRIAVDLYIKNEEGAILYTKRNVEPFAGMWHFPGSFLLKGESISECVKRIADEEINLNLNESGYKLIQLDEDLQEPRGHVIHIVYLVRVKKSELEQTDDKKFFFEPPQPMIPTHRRILLEIT